MLTKIEHQQFYDIKLEAGQEKWFYHHHSSNTTFKVVCLKKYGEVQIFVNATNLDKDVLEHLQNNNVNTEEFAFQSLYQNTLVVDSTNKKFCIGCYYLICIRAKKTSEGSIMLGSTDTKISLT
jgi:hypothetical protein